MNILRQQKRPANHFKIFDLELHNDFDPLLGISIHCYYVSGSYNFVNINFICFFYSFSLFSYLVKFYSGLFSSYLIS